MLYPDDRTYQGKELRLKQQFFMVSATLQDIIRRYLVTHKDESFEHFPEKVALQLNDTHPTIGRSELMRLLMDEHGLGWTKSWDITTRVFSFTNHTVLPEALEKWPVELVENVLPATCRSSTTSTGGSPRSCGGSWATTTIASGA